MFGRVPWSAAGTRRRPRGVESRSGAPGAIQRRGPVDEDLVVRHVIIFGYGHGLQRAIIDESQHRTTRTFNHGAALVRECACEAAMEATGVYWKPVWHILEDESSLTLVLANAQHIRNVPGRKSDRNDAAWIADLLAHGLIRGSFVPPAPIQELRDLTRTRKQLVREIARHTQRLQKTLEDANVKLTRVVTDILGVSGRAILAALIAGETDPERLADCTNVRGVKEGVPSAVESRRRQTRYPTFRVSASAPSSSGARQESEGIRSRV